MSEYFLKLPGDSQPRAYSEYEVREFLGQGVIDSKTLTWKQGMEGWQPVAQVLPPMSPIWEETQDQESKDQPEEQQYRLEEDIRVLSGTSLAWVIWIQGMVTEFSDCFQICHILKIFIIPCLDLLDLVRCTESIEEVDERNFTFDC